MRSAACILSAPVVRLPLATCGLLIALALPLAAGEKLDPSKAKRDDGDPTLWYDIRGLGVEGQGWTDLKAPYDRLPGKAEGVVRDPVWGLSRHSAGICVRFVTDATAIRARWTLTSPNLAMAHMPATGVSGVDLYVKIDGVWKWLACGFPAAQTNKVNLTGGIPAGTREFLLYLPLYNGVSSVELGLAPEAVLEIAPERPAARRKPIVFYGTSITQGGCASRPGMVHTSIVGRHLDYPVINLGFSGNGRMEPEMSDLFAELDPAVYVLDCLPNMDAAQVTERFEPFVKKLRAAHPETPILCVEDRTYQNAFLVTAQKDRNAASRAALKAAYGRLKEAEVPHLYYLEGEQLLGDDTEGTVDSSHPTDLGFLRQAEVFEKALRPILAK